VARITEQDDRGIKPEGVKLEAAPGKEGGK
jgi:hypothetical protein